jgi:hypothetical protein
MASVAELLVRIGADVSQATNALKGFANEAKASMQKAEAGSVALAAGLTAVGVAVSAFAVSAIKDLANVERINAQTAAALKSTGAAAWTSVEQINGLATALENMSGVQAESIQAGENLLLTFTNIKDGVGAGNDIFTQATKTMLDMSVAMGTDASSGAIQLGKALNDPTQGITALSRVGVSFTQQQKDQIKAMQEAGDVAGAQKIILAELAKEFGGSAAAAGQTAIGVFNKMANALGDIGEAALEQAMPDLKTFGREVTAEFRSVAAEIKRVGIAETLTEMVAPSDAAKAAIVALGGAITAALIPSAYAGATALIALAAPLAPFALAGAAAAVVAYDLYKIWQLWPEILSTAKAAWNLAVSAVQGAVAAIELKVKTGMAAAKAYVGDMVNGVKDWLGNKLKAAFDLVAKPIETARKAFFSLYDAVVGHSYIPDMVNETGAHMARLDENLAKPAAHHTKAAASAFEKMRTAVSKTMGEFAAKLGDAALEFKVTGDGAAHLAAQVTATKDAIRSLYRQGFDESAGSVQALRGNLSSLLVDVRMNKDLADGYAATLKTMADDADDLAQMMSGPLVKALSDLKTKQDENHAKALLLGEGFNEAKANADLLAGALPELKKSLGETSPIVQDLTAQYGQLATKTADDAAAKIANEKATRDHAAAMQSWGTIVKESLSSAGKVFDAMGSKIDDATKKSINFGLSIAKAGTNIAVALSGEKKDWVGASAGALDIIVTAMGFIFDFAGQAQREMDKLNESFLKVGRAMAASTAGVLADALSGKIDMTQFQVNFEQGIRKAVETAVSNALVQGVVMQKLQMYMASIVGALQMGNYDLAKDMMRTAATEARTAAANLVPILSEFKGIIGSAFSTDLSSMGGVGITGQGGSATTALTSTGAYYDIPALASGGITTGPTLAMIGEAGPEAVIPLDRLGGMGGNQINVTINATGNGEELGRLLVGELRRQGVRFA